MDEEKRVLLLPIDAYYRLTDDFMMVYSFLRYIIHIVQRGVNDPNDMRKLLRICDEFNPQAAAAYRRWNFVPGDKFVTLRFLAMLEDGAANTMESPVGTLSESVDALSAALLDTRASVEGFAGYLNRVMSGIDYLLDVLDEQDWSIPATAREARP